MPYVPAGERRQQLVEAAFRLMAEHGIVGATTRRIAAEAGVSLATVHYVFASKKELLRELTQVVVAEQSGAAKAALAHPGPDFHKTFLDGLRGAWNVVKERPDQQLVLFDLTTYALHDPELADLAKSQYEAYFLAAEEVLTAAADAAGLSFAVPLPTLARLTVAILDGLGFGWLADRNDAEAEQALEIAADLLAGLAVPAASRAQHEPARA